VGASMNIVFTCKCGMRLAAPEGRAGQRARCPHCGATTTVPPPAPEKKPAIHIGPEDIARVPPGAPRTGAKGGPRVAAASDWAQTGPGQLPLTMRANRRYEGRTCSICHAQIQLGEELRICEHCQSPFHMSCWEAHGGCATYGCEGATSASAQVGKPIETDKSHRFTEGPVAPVASRTGERTQPGLPNLQGGDMAQCPNCLEWVKVGATTCPHCKQTIFSHNKQANAVIGLVLTVITFLILWYAISWFVNREAEREYEKIRRDTEVETQKMMRDIERDTERLMRQLNQ